MNNADRIGPDGTVKYSQSGTYNWSDPYTGATHVIPRFTETTTLSPQQAATKGQTDAAEFNLGSLANAQSGFLKNYMAQPFDGSNEATESRLMELGRKRLDPMFAERQKALDSKLANQGITIGSKAYDTAQRMGSEQQNDAYNSLLLSGRGQAFSEAQATRNQPINEITALLSGSQVSMPQSQGFNQSPVPTTDTAGLINKNYDQRMGIWQQQQQQKQGILGGLFGLGSAALMSDRGMKTDIRQIGTSFNGLPIYAYRYKEGGPTMLGYMADEVEVVNPEAVVEFEGIKHVNYDVAVEAV